MVAAAREADIVDMTASPRLPSPRRSRDVVDLQVRRMGGERAMRAVASAPVRHLPAALLEALEHSWGTPEELGLAPAPVRHLRLVAG